MQIQPVANSHWGEWGPESFCPDNSWAQGFKLKVESDQGDFGDDTALNGVKLLCYDSAGAFVGEAASAYEQFGSWQAALYCSSRQSFLTGIRLRSKDVSARDCQARLGNYLYPTVSSPRPAWTRPRLTTWTCTAGTAPTSRAAACTGASGPTPSAAPPPPPCAASRPMVSRQ